MMAASTLADQFAADLEELEAEVEAEAEAEATHGLLNTSVDNDNRAALRTVDVDAAEKPAARNSAASQST